YAHNVGKVLAIPSQSVALLAALMLRGPQTTGELRINSERLHHFSDLSAVEGFLHELAARDPGAPGSPAALSSSPPRRRPIRSSVSPPQLATSSATPTVMSSPCPSWPHCAPTSQTFRAKSKRSRRASRSCALISGSLRGTGNTARSGCGVEFQTLPISREAYHGFSRRNSRQHDGQDARRRAIRAGQQQSADADGAADPPADSRHRGAA